MQAYIDFSNHLLKKDKKILNPDENQLDLALSHVFYHYFIQEIHELLLRAQKNQNWNFILIKKIEEQLTDCGEKQNLIDQEHFQNLLSFFKVIETTTTSVDTSSPSLDISYFDVILADSLNETQKKYDYYHQWSYPAFTTHAMLLMFVSFIVTFILILATQNIMVFVGGVSACVALNLTFTIIAGSVHKWSEAREKQQSELLTSLREISNHIYRLYHMIKQDQFEATLDFKTNTLGYECSSTISRKKDIRSLVGLFFTSSPQSSMPHQDHASLRVLQETCPTIKE